MVRSRFMAQMEQLNTELIVMGTLCENALEKVANALENPTDEVSRDIIILSKKTEEKERELENICINLLLKQQPVASDLRQISSALKMVTDMERIGDHATDISELAIVLSKKTYVKKLDHIEEMAKETMVMLIQSLEAFVEKDLDKAQKVIAHDDVVDDLFEKVKKELIALIRDHADEGEQAVDLLMVTKYFERIGDHATNIAEWVIFSITGQIVA